MFIGIGEEYDYLVTSINSRTKSFSLTELYAHILSFEMRKEQQQKTFQITANNVVHSNNFLGGKDNYRGKGRNSSSGRKKQFFRNISSLVRTTDHNKSMRKMGHVALKCYHSFDHSYQAEETHAATLVSTPSYGIDTNWYTDSGATYLITSELDKISIYDKYQGKDQIHTANDTCMSISHIGQTHIPTSNHFLELKNILHVLVPQKSYLST